MRKQPNWIKIKQVLLDQFIDKDFKSYSSTAFTSVDFDKGLEIFRYLLELKVTNHDQNFNVLESLNEYEQGHQSKDVLSSLVRSFEPYLKKLFQLIGDPFPADKGLAFGFKQLFLKVQNPVRTFFDYDDSTGTRSAKFPSSTYLNFLGDSSKFGISLHACYHLRNSNIHNDPAVGVRDVPQILENVISTYLYFTLKYYNELIAVIPSSALDQSTLLTLKSLASLSGGAYNPTIENEVKRDNLIQTIERKLKDLDVLFETKECRCCDH